eukprot:7473588-Alexandrium_andersonii.AAC.1
MSCELHEAECLEQHTPTQRNVQNSNTLETGPHSGTQLPNSYTDMLVHALSDHDRATVRPQGRIRHRQSTT